MTAFTGWIKTCCFVKTADHDKFCIGFTKTMSLFMKLDTWYMYIGFFHLTPLCFQGRSLSFHILFWRYWECVFCLDLDFLNFHTGCWKFLHYDIEGAWFARLTHHSFQVRTLIISYSVCMGSENMRFTWTLILSVFMEIADCWS